jgi:oligopeptidase B
MWNRRGDADIRIALSFVLFALGGVAVVTTAMAQPGERDRQSLLDTELKAPVARVEPHAVTLHDDTRVDDYFWLRDDKRQNPEVLAYLEAENNYSARVMAPTDPLQQKIFEEIKARTKETDLSVPYLEKGWYYYTRTEEGKQHPIFCRKSGSLEAPEEVYLDKNVLGAGYDYFEFGAIDVSPDGAILAFSTDNNGSEVYTLEFKNLVSGESLPDRIVGASSVVWAVDNRHVFYTTLDEAKREYRLYRHELGTPAESDPLLFEETDALYSLYLYRTRSDAFIVFGSGSSTTSDARLIPADRPTEPARLVEERTADVEYYLDHRGDTFYIRTNRDAKNFKIVTAKVAAPAAAHWKDFIAHRPDVKIEDIDLFADNWVVAERQQGLRRYRVGDFAAKTDHYIDFPDAAYYVGATGNAEFATPTFRFNYQSMTTPSSVYDYDMTTRRRTLLKQTEVLGGFDPTQLVSERIYATAYDGAEVPISIVYRKGTPLDGSAPMLLYGYGSYGISTDATFSVARLSLLDRGVVYAMAHVRGGGEMGETWHDQGKMFYKRNTFTDFITAAEYLVAKKYTSTDRLAILGGSAGGLLVGAVVNMRPDLFKCAVAKVPFVDVMNTILDPNLPLSVGEYLEWGNPNEKEPYFYMRSYCPYTNVTPQRYPAMLVTCGLNDPRVSYWEAAKWVARLRAKKLDDNVLLLKTNMGSGHFGFSGRYDAWKDVAFDYAFILSQLRVTG